MINDFYELDPYELNSADKEEMLRKELIELTSLHKDKCKEYADFLEAVGYDAGNVKGVADIPFFPVRMFKEYDLKSIGDDEVFKTMTSSGTTGQKVSKIFLDKETAMIQQKVMVKILSSYWGKKRLPMLVIDTPEVVRNREMFTARGAAIIGLQVVSRDTVYASNDDMTLNFDVLDDFLSKYGDGRFIIFGFTFLVWEHFYKELLKADKKYDMSEAFLMTGGGWKKLESEAVSRQLFKEKLKSVCNIGHFLDHYGMVEQTGCIYAECECGNLHASIYSDVITRRYEDFSPCDIGEKGIIQVVSALPHSYPGHSLLTEDEGIILGEDDCPCGRKGKYIQIIGRLKSAELRGCSDTYADKYGKN
ncbi:MAG: acyl-protein synthetase [Lachnospiraceae bacterium]|jgi:phenylacetate-coenzyme A ligase PaaK-like adenylate-forming protein|nr:acyl-protein synthetase [Lachnospiraceae bacterium]